MTPLARQSDIASPVQSGVMARAILSRETPHLAEPANDVTAKGRHNLLVRRRRRLTRREAH